METMIKMTVVDRISILARNARMDRANEKTALEEADAARSLAVAAEEELAALLRENGLRIDGDTLAVTVVLAQEPPTQPARCDHAFDGDEDTPNGGKRRCRKCGFVLNQPAADTTLAAALSAAEKKSTRIIESLKERQAACKHEFHTLKSLAELTTTVQCKLCGYVQSVVRHKPKSDGYAPLGIMDVVDGPVPADMLPTLVTEQVARALEEKAQERRGASLSATLSNSGWQEKMAAELSKPAGFVTVHMRDIDARLASEEMLVALHQQHMKCNTCGMVAPESLTAAIFGGPHRECKTPNSVTGEPGRWIMVKP